MAIKIKSWKVLKGLMEVAFHPKAVALAIWIACRYSETIFTSAYRAKRIHTKDSGIHGTDPCRAFDLRSWVYEKPYKVRDDINAHWVYDPKRPRLRVAIIHDTGQGIHFHCQVHNNTEYHKDEVKR